ncbi:citron Rho-interacting kinase-like isoform X2 [Paramacrobiotus metropolitanus]|uniref:citron Rho-interacting kinase-like isoform X2 n=1 Tax=Paramacrobiotus metropolitanus TaxID=2943436 RepID=UPI0024458307|nr:citron Rho-interacting kinase-like isoform X2 [Paramacrobiotus metropolitanus]
MINAMADTPSSRGSGACVRKPSTKMSKMDEFDVLKRRLVDKEREVESLKKTVDSYETKAVQHVQESDSLKTQLNELRKELSESRLITESVSHVTTKNVKVDIVRNSPVALYRDLASDNSGEESSDCGLMVQKHVAEKDLDSIRHKQLEWSFSDNEQMEMSDADLRTSLLERILDMAQNSESFRIQLIENMEILLRAKELSVSDPEDKKALQNSIAKARDKRHSLKKSLESGFDDLDERVNTCFAGLAEFEAFRKFFNDELEEIKRVYDVANPQTPAQLTPLAASSPVKNISRSALRLSHGFSRNRDSARATVRFDDKAGLNHSRFSSGSALGESPQVDCKDCARYRALLRSFRTTQEADKQKQQEQLRTIEKLSCVITNAKRIPRRQSQTLSSLSKSVFKPHAKMDEPDRCEVDLATRRLNFDGSPAFTADLEIPVADRSDCGDFSKGNKLFLGVPDLIDEFRASETVSFILDKSKEFGEQTDLETAIEKDLKVENTMLKNKISALEYSLEKAQKSGVSENASPYHGKITETAKLERSLDEANRELKKLREENKKLLCAGEEMNSTCELQEEIEKLKSLESVNTTTDMSYVQSSMVLPPDYQTGIPYPVLLEEFRKLESDFNETARIAESLLSEKKTLEFQHEASESAKNALQQENATLHKERYRLTQEITQLKAFPRQNPDVVEQHNDKVLKLERQLEIAERVRRQLQEEVEKLTAERNEAHRLIKEHLQLREQALKDIATTAALRTRFDEERQDLLNEIESEHSIVVHLRSELERLGTALQIAEKEKEFVQTSLRKQQEEKQESYHVPVVDVRNSEWERDLFDLEKKNSDLKRDCKALKEAGIQLTRENLYLQKELERHKVTEQQHGIALEECAALRLALNAKDKELNNYMAEIQDQKFLLQEAQTSFDKENKGVFSKFLAPFKKPHATQSKRLPRRSQTLTISDDFGGKAPLREQAQAQQKMLAMRTTSKIQKSSVVSSVKAGTLPVKSSSIVKTEVAHHHTKPNVTLPSTSVIKLQTPSPRLNSANKGPSKAALSKPASAVSIREPFVAPGHPHTMKIFMNFRAQKCNICLGNIPYFSHAEKCTECKHVYHIRCAKEIKGPACAAAEILAEEERKGRPSLQSAGLDETDLVPDVEGYLLLKRRGESDFSKIYAELVKDTLCIYERKPADTGDYTPVLERIDLNENRRQAEITCHRTVPETEVGLPQYDAVHCFAIEVKFAKSAVEPLKYYFQTRGIVEKHNWTATVQAVLTENEVETVEATSKHFRVKNLLSYQMDMVVVSSCLFYDQGRMLVGTDKGLFVMASEGGVMGGLVPVEGYDGLPIYQLSIHEATKEILVLAGENQTLYRGDLYSLLKWTCSEVPLLSRQLFSAETHGCHLMESFEQYLAVAHNGRVTVYEYKNRNTCRSLITVRGADILEEGVSAMDNEHPARSLNFIKSRNKLQLIIGLTDFWCCDVVDFKRDVPGLTARKGQSSVVVKPFLRPLVRNSTTQYCYFMDKGRVQDDLLEGFNSCYTMGFFPIPSAAEHKKNSPAERVYLLCFYDGWLFVNGNGVPTGSEHIGWKGQTPRLIHYEYPYVYVLHTYSIQVRRIVDGGTGYSLSPPFFYKLDDPWVVGDSLSHCVVMVSKSKDARSERMNIQQLDVDITEDDVEQRRRMPTVDNDTESTFSAAFTDPL